MRLVLATRNAGKKRELQALVAGQGITLATLDEFPEAAEPDETGATFRDNALIKARAAAEATQLWALADDSGLCVDALGGRPGVHSARYAKGPDEARIAKLLDEMQSVPIDRRAARFVCALALVGPGGEELTEEGVVEGRVALASRGVHGFGYDPVFVVADDPNGRTMAELSDPEKRGVSHRGRALAKLRPQLVRLVRG